MILHNDGAVNFTLTEAPVSDPTQQRTLIDHRDDVRLDAVDAFAGHLVVSYRREALPRIQLWPIDSDGGYGEPEEVSFDSELMSCGLGGNPAWDSPKLRIRAGSLVTPAQVYDIDLPPGSAHCYASSPSSGIIGPPTTLNGATGRSRTTAPGSRCRSCTAPDIELPAPALLYGYGAYEICTDPSFSIARLSLLDRGMAFVIAHVRGGGEMGRLWYEHGKLLEKKNTFTDFVTVARHLVDSGLTRPQQLVALGGSAGGLLVGAVANLAPDLFAGILAQVPFVDPLTTILDPSLPLTVTEWDEWGNPLSDGDVYSYMKSYSPYENVEAKRYPAILAMTSLNDTRVYYVEPAKWVAALRHANADGSPILLKTQMNAGHGGVSGRYKAWQETAFQYSWLLAAADGDRYGGGQKDDLHGGPHG